MSNSYENLINNARKKQLKLTQEQNIYIKNIYEDVSRSLSIKSSKAKNKSLSQRWLKDYNKSINIEIDKLNKILYKNNKEIIKKSADIATSTQLDFFYLINDKYDLGMDQTFKTVFSRIPNDVISEIVNGGLYEDGKGLSTRIWSNSRKTNKDIQYVINKAIAEKKSVYDLSKDLEVYINPKKRKPWPWKKVYPRVGKKEVDYSAQRLARTCISHAFTLALARGCSKNPYVEEIRWRASSTKPCDVCLDKDGNVYTPETLPLDHPNGMCSQIPIVTKSSDEIGRELRSWLNNGSNPMLDDWYSKYGKEFAK